MQIRQIHQNIKKGGFIEHDQCIPGLKSCHFRLSPKYHSQVGKNRITTR